jgi:hypothetical protein
VHRKEPSSAHSCTPIFHFHRLLDRYQYVHSGNMTDRTVDEKMADAEFKEVAPDHAIITPQQIQARFETLRHLSEEQMTALNKKLVKKLDWRLMPCITLMFLMK